MTRDRLLQLSTADAGEFRPFSLRVDGLNIEITHPNMIAFHPELPWIVIYSSDGVQEVLPEDVAVVTVEHAK